MSHVIAAVATGKIPCAIGILRLSGDGCADVAGKVFRAQSGNPLAMLQPRTLHLGTLLDRQGRVLDQVVAIRCAGPHSYTGEDTVELQCHGSPAVLSAALEALYAAGAEPARPGEFTQRAFLNGKLDLTAAEAVIDLIDAQTADAAANAAGQLGGALLRKIGPIYDALADVCAHYHAVLDYPDEDIPDFALQDFDRTLAGACADLGRLLATCERGRVLKHGVRVALIGKPNVGKSSLLNALAGYERVIVTQIPGTTRDTVEEVVRFGTVTARITDTAGIRTAGDAVEALGVERAAAAAKEADLAVFVCDGSQPLDADDRRAMAAAQTCKRSLALINKRDLPQQVYRVQLPFEPVFAVSAKNAVGLEALAAYVEATFRSDLPCNGEILTNPRQAHALEIARDALVRVREAMQAHITPDAVLTDVEAAMEALGELTGKTVREDITQRIFERFCVGK